MNLFLMPMWFLSGALFPVENASAPLRWVMRLNPLTYGLTGLRQSLYWGDAVGGNFALSLGVSVAFAAVMFLLASAVAGGRVSSDLQ
jgi:ABC-2 type transport system permease protein